MKSNTLKLVRALLISLLALSAGVAMAKNFPDQGSGIIIPVPDGWETSEGEGGSKMATSPGGKSIMVYHVINAKDAQRDAAIEKAFLANMEKVTMEKSKAQKLEDGLNTIVKTGTGTLEGTGTVEFAIAGIQNNGKKVILILVVLPGGNWQVLNGVPDAIRRAKTFPDQGSGIVITLPAGWEISEGEGASKRAVSPGEKSILIYHVINANDAQGDAAIEKAFLASMENVTMEESEVRKLQDGLNTIIKSGTGTAEGTGAIEFAILGIQNNGKKTILIAAILPGGGDKNVLIGIVDGIRKTL